MGGPRASLLDRALAFVHSSMPSSFGAAAGEQPTFFPDPVVQRTSAGAAAVGALQVARELSEAALRGVVVTLFPDRADRYLPPEVRA